MSSIDVWWLNLANAPCMSTFSLFARENTARYLHLASFCQNIEMYFHSSSMLIDRCECCTAGPLQTIRTARERYAEVPAL